MPYYTVSNVNNLCNPKYKSIYLYLLSVWTNNIWGILQDSCLLYVISLYNHIPFLYGGVIIR